MRPFAVVSSTIVVVEVTVLLTYILAVNPSRSYG